MYKLEQCEQISKGTAILMLFTDPERGSFVVEERPIRASTSHPLFFANQCLPRGGQSMESFTESYYEQAAAYWQFVQSLFPLGADIDLTTAAERMTKIWQYYNRGGMNFELMRIAVCKMQLHLSEQKALAPEYLQKHYEQQQRDLWAEWDAVKELMGLRD